MRKGIIFMHNSSNYESLLKDVKSAGFDNFELRWNTAEYYKGSSCNQVANTILREGLGINYMHEHYGLAEDFWRFNPEARSNVERAIDACTRYRISNLVYHLSNDYPVGDRSAKCMQELHHMIMYARDNNVNFCIENTADNESLIEVFKELAEYYPNTLKLCLDTGHLNAFGGKELILNNVELFKGRVTCVHMHDNWGGTDEHLPPFSGSVDWEEVVKFLVAVDYQGALSMELRVLPVSVSETNLTCLKRLVYLLNKVESMIIKERGETR